MTDISPTPVDEMDLDDFLDGAKRTVRSVTIYGRGDLVAARDELLAEQRILAAIPDEDRSMSDRDGSHLDAQIDAINAEMYKHRKTFHVSFLDADEQEAILAAVKKDLKAEIDAAAQAAVAEAKEGCRRSAITSVTDINQVVREMSAKAVAAVTTKEFNVRAMTAAIQAPPVTVDQVRKLYSLIGSEQVAMFTRAFNSAESEAPQVAVPKSLRPSPSDDGAMSS